MKRRLSNKFSKLMSTEGYSRLSYSEKAAYFLHRKSWKVRLCNGYVSPQSKLIKPVMDMN